MPRRDLRPQKNSRAAAAMATAAPPIAMPAIAPGDRVDLCDSLGSAADEVAAAVGTVDVEEELVDVEVGAAVDVVANGSDSDGQLSPGSSMKLELAA